MRYTTFGHRAGLRVSEYALGTANFGTGWGAGCRARRGPPHLRLSESVNDGRLWCVMTNTGVWNGGSSPHQLCHSWSCQGPRCGPNVLRPMISAPMLRA